MSFILLVNIGYIHAVSSAKGSVLNDVLLRLPHEHVLGLDFIATSSSWHTIAEADAPQAARDALQLLEQLAIAVQEAVKNGTRDVEKHFLAYAFTAAEFKGHLRPASGLGDQRLPGMLSQGRPGDRSDDPMDLDVQLDGVVKDIAAVVNSKKRSREDVSADDQLVRLLPRREKPVTHIEHAKFEDSIRATEKMGEAVRRAVETARTVHLDLKTVLTVVQMLCRMIGCMFAFFCKDESVAARLIPEMTTIVAQVAATAPPTPLPSDQAYVSMLLKKFGEALSRIAK